MIFNTNDRNQLSLENLKQLIKTVLDLLNQNYLEAKTAKIKNRWISFSNQIRVTKQKQFFSYTNI